MGTGEVMIDATHHGGIACFINNSHGPNLSVVKVSVDGLTRLCFKALRDIRQLEELSYLYKWTTRKKDDLIPCFCRHSSCPGTIQKLIVSKKKKKTRQKDGRARLLSNVCYWATSPLAKRSTRYSLRTLSRKIESQLI